MLGVYGWDLRDVLIRTADSSAAEIEQPTDNLLSQIVESSGARAALRVLPRATEADRRRTLLDAAADLGDEVGDQETGDEPKHGIETLVVFLGANDRVRGTSRTTPARGSPIVTSTGAAIRRSPRSRRVPWTVPSTSTTTPSPQPSRRPPWWRPYPLPPELAALSPVPDSQFLTSDATGRRSGGLFSLDGMHPTTVGYGIIAQELIDIMVRAGVRFNQPDGQTPRTGPIRVDFTRLIRQDTLLTRPPTNVTAGLEALCWADETLDLIRRVVP